MLAVPKLIGHRGAASHAPENTLASLREAARQGAGGVEVDVVLTRDGVPVLFHDDVLDRTSTGTGPVGEATLEEIRALDAGSWFGPAFAGEKVPTLEECLTLCLELNLSINLEIKPQKGAEARTAEVALDLARRLWPENRPLPLISSFKIDSLLAARRVVPHWPRGYLFDKRPDDWARTADAIGAAALHVDHKQLSPARVAEYKATGRPVLVWTVNDPDRARELWTWGVDGIITDTPKSLAVTAPA